VIFRFFAFGHWELSMLLFIFIAALGFILISMGIKGFTKTGIQLSKTKKLRGKTGRTVGTICIAFGVIVALVGFGLMVWLSSVRR
jgi:hypothetical protein